MDILIFLATLLAVLVGGLLLVKLVLRARSSGRRGKKYVSVPTDSRLKQPHTGRPYLQHQTFSRRDKSDEVWKEGRRKDKETSFGGGSFTANEIRSDSEKRREPGKQHEGLAMPVIDYGPAEQPASRPARDRTTDRGGRAA